MADIRIEIDEAIKAHDNWRVRLKDAAAKGERSIPVRDIARDDCCRFGKWLNSIEASQGGNPHYRKACMEHTAFHKEAGRIAQMIQRGEDASARMALNGLEYTSKSAALNGTLATWLNEL